MTNLERQYFFDMKQGLAFSNFTGHCHDLCLTNPYAFPLGPRGPGGPAGAAGRPGPPGPPGKVIH
jgi:hypothetical protein